MRYVDMLTKKVLTKDTVLQQLQKEIDSDVKTLKIILVIEFLGLIVIAFSNLDTIWGCLGCGVAVFFGAVGLKLGVSLISMHRQYGKANKFAVSVTTLTKKRSRYVAENPVYSVSEAVSINSAWGLGDGCTLEAEQCCYVLSCGKVKGFYPVDQYELDGELKEKLEQWKSAQTGDGKIDPIGKW